MTDEQTTAPAQPCGEDAANGAMEKLRALPWLDKSTADPVEKSRRMLMHLIEPDSVYYFEDGFPRPELKQQARNCLAVLNALAVLNSLPSRDQVAGHDHPRDFHQTLIAGRRRNYSI